MSIFIHHGNATLEIRSATSPAEASTPAEMEAQIEHLLAGTPPIYPVYAPMENMLPPQLVNRFQWIEAAGGIVKDQAGDILLIHRRGHWDLPKGKIDAGETALEAAHREIAEETGLNHLQELAECRSTYHVYRMQERWYLKKTHWFLFELKIAQDLVLQTEEDIVAAQWMNASEIRTVWKELYPSLQPLLESVIG